MQEGPQGPSFVLGLVSSEHSYIVCVIMRSRPSNLEQARVRTPLLLLGALLLNVLTISGLTLYALRGQRAQLLESLRESKRHALTLLASRIEQSLLQTIQAPFLAAGELPFTDISPQRLHRVRLSFPAVEQFIFFNDHRDLIQSIPAPANRRQRRLNRWIVQRVQEERTGETFLDPHVCGNALSKAP